MKQSILTIQMNRWLKFLCCLVVFCLRVGIADATSLPVASITQSHTTVHLKSSVADIKPNSEFWLLLDWSLDPNWYIYAQDPGDGGLPPTLEFTLPAHVVVEETLWPKAQYLSKQGLSINGYKGTCQTFIRLKVSPDYKPSALDAIAISLRWGVCHDQCMVDNATLSLRFPTNEVFDVGLFDRVHKEEVSRHVYDTDAHIWFLLIFAFLGGIILNLMPCVLPVLSLKLLDFAKLRSTCPEDSTSIRVHALLYTLGVLFTFQLLNGGLSMLRMFGKHVGWGFQMQSPPFLIFLTCLFLFLALNLFGVFEIGLRTIHLENTLSKRKAFKPRFQSFMKGMLACVVATPCSAPFMGTAIAASLVQPFWVNSLIFMSLGFGLSFPFLCLTVWPNVVHYLPKPGVWMQSMKQFMGFLMLGSVGWMLWILSARYADGVPWMLLGLWCISLGFWFYGKLCSPVQNAFKRGVGIVLLVFFNLGAFYFFYEALDDTVVLSDQLVFKPYSQEALDAALKENKPVLINFTARWCITCQTNKKFVLESKAIVDRLKADGVVLLEADWTHHDAVITKKLESFGQNSIPFIVFYPKAKDQKTQIKPVFLSAILTESQLIEALSRGS
ncbi:MAG: thioredoxin family protein [Candidatus Paracaedibacteraceae bacterium]|nr:thioredoxin family protein [Candidatus Paracaedibacteraceae bacterium]